MCVMKNITLSIPDDLLLKCREYAQKHNTSLNQIIRDLLKNAVQSKNTVDKLLEKSDRLAVNTDNYTWNRDEIYDRKILRWY